MQREQRTFLGHPVGLYVLFFAEMWERFSYYGMRALLMLYMVNHFKWSQQGSSTVYKLYTTLVYVTPILGGFLADKYLGNKWAVIIGAVLMAFGHFMMAFEARSIFAAALVLLIIGNGFFKPNMSTQVGRLYPPNDDRRDGAYTIFYMGINIGAFLSPLACGWLRENTLGGFHSGFTIAGIGMVLGLVTYLAGLPFIREVANESSADRPEPATSNPAKPGQIQPAAVRPGEALTEEQASATPSVLAGKSMPTWLAGAGGLCVVFAAVYVFLNRSAIWDPAAADRAYLLGEEGIGVIINAGMLVVGGVCLGLMAFVCGKVQNGMRDRVLTILILGIFSIFFWGAFEQAGNALNLWADKNTNRYLTAAVPDDGYPAVAEKPAVRAEGEAQNEFLRMFQLKPAKPGAKADSWASTLNPAPTEWFQSINALGIFVLAPLFALLWVKVASRGILLTVPVKMMLGLLMMSASVAVMLAAAAAENGVTVMERPQLKIPEGLAVDAQNRLGVSVTERTEDGLPKKDANGRIVTRFKQMYAGRLTVEPSGRMTLYGALPDTERDAFIRATAPPEFVAAVKRLVNDSQKANVVFPLKVTLKSVPDGFESTLPGLALDEVDYRPQARELMALKPLDERETLLLSVAAGEPEFRHTIRDLYVVSQKFRVSPWWLVWSYILATLGELCLSPVGLSMVSKLAPAKYATMLMGVWLLTSAFGNFAAGALGEVWGTVTPSMYFTYSTAATGVAALVLLLIVRPVSRAMHGVN